MHNFYPRPPRGGRLAINTPTSVTAPISIHALREEGDFAIPLNRVQLSYFYPRPPRGGRRSHLSFRQGIGHFYPRPPRGGRLSPVCGLTLPRIFLSTPSARRATCAAPVATAPKPDFYPRPPRGGRQQKQRENTLLLSHYTPPCTNCKEMSANQTAKSHRYLRKRLVFRCEASRKTMCAAGSHWPDIKKSARYPVQTPGAVQRARPWSGSCCPAGRTADCPRQGRSGRSALL